ncbi:cytochrome P450 [Rhizophagus irregularis DAOM 181602=DAOM 197198]|nr:cytochrome P450 [Rhizophagus irregularis DAOM 181602=DAOM 197198]
MRAIVLCRGECIDDFLSKNTHGLRFHNFKGPEELGFEGKARITNHGCLTIIFLIKSYLNCSLAAYFNTLSDEKSDHQSNKSQRFFEIISSTSNASYGIFNIFRNFSFYTTLCSIF